MPHFVDDTTGETIWEVDRGGAKNTVAVTLHRKELTLEQAWFLGQSLRAEVLCFGENAWNEAQTVAGRVE